MIGSGHTQTHTSAASAAKFALCTSALSLSHSLFFSVVPVAQGKEEEGVTYSEACTILHSKEQRERGKEGHRGRKRENWQLNPIHRRRNDRNLLSLAFLSDRTLLLYSYLLLLLFLISLVVVVALVSYFALACTFCCCCCFAYFRADVSRRRTTRRRTHGDEVDDEEEEATEDDDVNDNDEQKTKTRQTQVTHHVRCDCALKSN